MESISELKELRKRTGLSAKKFADKYNIPKRTYEKWESGERTPPLYVINMLTEKVERDLFLMSIAKDVCNKLEIDFIPINFGMEEESKGNLAKLNIVSGKAKNITLTDRSNINPYDIILALVHELRHAYQIKHNPKILEGYKQIGEISLEDYNLQKAELDANAYASLYMEQNFKLKPTWNGYSEKVKKEIEKRKREL